MNVVSRRQFLRTSMAGAGVLATAPHCLAAAGTATAVRFRGNDIVELGNTGIKVSRLAQGTGFNGSARSSAHTRIGKEAFARLLHHAIDEGIRFIDMADLYGSHPFVKDTIRGMPRDKFALLTKIWPRKENWNTPSGGAKQEMDRFRMELKVDQIDICLIHCMQNANWPKEYEGICDELADLKARGVIRAVGVSCHNLDALKVAAAHPWTDVIFARINHKCGKEYSCDGSVEEVSEVLKTARGNGKAVVGMKIFGAGKLVKPEEKDASLRYVLQNDLVDAVTIGMLKESEVDDTLQRMSRVSDA